MIEHLKTDPELIKRLRESAAKPVTKEQLERQRVSFVFGNLPRDSTITREEVERRIRSNEGS